MTTTTKRPNDNKAVRDDDVDEPFRNSLVRKAALRTITRLQGGYRKDNPAAVAAVARLRREAGREAHASPTSWGLADLEALTELREEEWREGSGPSRYLSSKARRWHELREEREDRAVHLAVTLWALHQQSLRDEPMHVPDWPLGRGVRRLAHGKTGTQDPKPQSGEHADGEPSDASSGEGRKAEPVEDVSPTVRKRFVRIGTSADFDTLGRRLREMVLLLRNAHIPLDYGLLAEQLYRWQDEATQSDVRRSWGRDFHRLYGRATPDDEQDTSTAPVSAPDQPVDDAGD
ncbi:type I-E CRISPR-associated protein Cse2/CasB [Streptomyces sp. NPDC093097]|uniref:type I-E CRISPR-associated protein Cse2/CasB n=1 Tax=Streptomyces sp. NPDC093097 TaxID=3366027 RepID=UPI0038157AC7